MDNREIFNYLSEDEKKRIAERVFEDELRKSFQSKYENTFKKVFAEFNHHIIVSSEAAKSFNAIYVMDKHKSDSKKKPLYIESSKVLNNFFNNCFILKLI